MYLPNGASDLTWHGGYVEPFPESKTKKEQWLAAEEWEEEQRMAAGRNWPAMVKTVGDLGHATSDARTFTMALSRVITK